MANQVATLSGLIPLRLSNPSMELSDLAGELLAKSTRLGSELPPKMREDLRILSAILNTYASNLIEGHDTRPAEIKKALEGEFSRDERRRRLQEEARASASIQMTITQQGLNGTLGSVGAEFLSRLHRTFFETVPELLAVKSRGKDFYSNLPGKFRGEGQAEYKDRLSRADLPRQSSTGDGRGSLSENGLRSFVEWFLRVAIDQVDYMAGLYDLAGLSERLLAVGAVSFPRNEKVLSVLKAVLARGEITRSEAWNAAGQSDRTGRQTVKLLLDSKVFISKSERAGLRINIYRPELFPGLLPSAPDN